MNGVNITKYGTILTKFRQSLSVFSSLYYAEEPIRSVQRACFSQICNPFRSTESSKVFLASSTALEINSRGFKKRGELQLRCKDCYMVRKDGQMMVLCSSYPRHKQIKMRPRLKRTWILTFAFQSKQRPY